jgi:hemoglobin
VTAAEPSLFDQVGAARLRAMVADFYERVFADVMIGFLFVGKDRAHLIEREWELAARMLGGDVAYAGRPLREAHRRSPILGGHFDRRLELWRQAMVDHDLPPAAQEVLLRHNRALRAQVTADPTSDCNHTQTANATEIAAPIGLTTLGRRR